LLTGCAVAAETHFFFSVQVVHSRMLFVVTCYQWCGHVDAMVVGD